MESGFVAACYISCSTVTECTIADQIGGPLSLHDGRIDQCDAVAKRRSEVRLEQRVVRTP